MEAFHPDDAQGDRVGALQSEPRELVETDRLPRHVIHAVLAAEDRRFFDHPGVSPAGSVRAGWVNLTAGELRQGGSTITQQYVGAVVFAGRPSVWAKLREAVLAVKLEQKLSKREILARYLNTIYWGRGVHGLQAAAKTYFHVPAHRLSVNQAATLAGMIARPGALDPVKSPDAADARRRYTLDGMAAEGWLGNRRARQLIGRGLPPVKHGTVAIPDVGGYYLEAAREQAAELLGPGAFDHGYVIQLEMDADMQYLAEQLMRRRVAGQPYSGALVAVDPRNGGVRALVGGPGTATQPLNTATRANRQPGSAFKAFTLAAAVERGYSPGSPLPAPSEVRIPGADGGHTISNFGHASPGVQTVREATASSTNTAFAQLVEQVGPEAVVEAAHRAGITSQLPAVPTITLGTGSVTPLEMAGSFATFAADGVRHRPRLIARVTTPDGRTVIDPGPHGHRAFAPQVARTVTDMLTEVIDDGTGTAAQLDRQAAGKTGTTDDYRDAWFVGYVPQLTAAVWLGRLDNGPMGSITGGDAPAAIWQEFMEQALTGLPPRGFPEPPEDEEGATVDTVPSVRESAQDEERTGRGADGGQPGTGR